MLPLYKNIKSKRTELKMSQDTLAELTGYKDRSSIAKIRKRRGRPRRVKNTRICKSIKSISPRTYGLG